LANFNVIRLPIEKHSLSLPYWDPCVPGKETRTWNGLSPWSGIKNVLYQEALLRAKAFKSLKIEYDNSVNPRWSRCTRKDRREQPIQCKHWLHGNSASFSVMIWTACASSALPKRPYNQHLTNQDIISPTQLIQPEKGIFPVTIKPRQCRCSGSIAHT